MLGGVEAWQKIGAENNASWCDLVVGLHGGHGDFAVDAWTSSQRTPPLYPDAITLITAPEIPNLLGRIDTSAGCTIKDSFASLDLETYGFRVLFDAQWIMQPVQTTTEAGIPRGWTTFSSPGDRERWEAAWGQDDGHQELALSRLHSDDVVFVGRIEEDRVAAGGILNLSAGVVGISNVFAEENLGSAAWFDLANFAGALFPDLPLMSYERGESLKDAQHAGFQAVGPLRIWIAED